MWRSTLEIGAGQLRSVTEIKSKSPFYAEQKPYTGYGFRAAAKDILCSMNRAQNNSNIGESFIALPPVCLF